MSYNKCIFIGNLTKDPELRYMPQGTPVANFSIAINTKYSDKEEVLFMPVVVFGKMAEVTCKYLVKGSQCLVEGRLVERRWQSNGEKRKMEVIASTVRFLSKKRTEDGSPPEEHTDLEPF